VAASFEGLTKRLPARDRFDPPVAASSLKLAKWAWHASKPMSLGIRSRAKFVFSALRNPAATGRFNDPNPILEDLIAEDPRTVGNLMWPYQCTAWSADQRIDRIEGHLAAVRKLPALRLALNGPKLVFAELSDTRDGVALMLDRPPWLVREGHLTLSIFLNEFRALSVSFSISDDDLFIGGIQGRQVENVVAIYRDLTKDFHGLRPRDLLLEGLRVFANRAGLQRIYAVADEFKVSTKDEPRRLELNEIWQDRGGRRSASSFYELPISPRRRPVQEIIAKKRPMYRRRYAMLDDFMANATFDPAPFATFDAT